MNVPFLDLKTQYKSIKDEIDAEIGKVLENTAFAGGPFVKAFEKDFAEYCNVKHAIGCGSGTEALWIILLAMGVGPGDEVITTPNTFIATAEAITFVGATPVFVDVVEPSYSMDPTVLEAAITNKTRAIIPVHIFGQVCDMDPIMDIADRYGLKVIEDACQAHGAEYKGKRAGSIGDAAAFSFYPGKNLGAFGEGGGITTNDDELAAWMHMFLNHGQEKKYYHEIIGWNGRLDGIQGAVLKVKLGHLDKWNELRRSHAARYRALLLDVKDLSLPVEEDYSSHVYHIFAVRCKERDELLAYLNENGIGAGIHYPVPVHLQSAYSELGYSEGSFPVAEQSASEFISLPMFPDMTDEQIERVVSVVKKFYAERYATV
jgi:dTDP-4-amino-4,6-dideoxygalactose transaminase